MRAVAVMEPNRVELVDIPMPVTGDYDALVRVRACGICSSTDLKIVHYEHPEMPGFPFQFPAILGHEGAGEIVSVGPKVRYLKVGDRVVSPLAMGIPECGFSMSYGGMVEYGVVPDIRAMNEDRAPSPFGNRPISMDPQDFLSKVFPNDISFVDAAMMLTFKENYSALKNFGIKEGMDVLIFGDGSIGMGLSLQLRAYHVHSVIVVGHHDDRLARIARVAGPDLTINAHKEDVKKRLEGRRFDIVIDAAGSVEIIKRGARFLKPGGKVCVYGVLGKGKSTLDLYDIPNNTAVQIMSYPYREHRTHDTIVDMMLRGVIKASDFYSTVLPVERAAEAIHMLETREAFKVILTFD